MLSASYHKRLLGLAKDEGRKTALIRLPSFVFRLKARIELRSTVISLSSLPQICHYYVDLLLGREIVVAENERIGRAIHHMPVERIAPRHLGLDRGWLNRLPALAEF